MIYTTIVSSVIILIILMMRLIFLKKGNPNFIYFLWFFAFETEKLILVIESSDPDVFSGEF